MKRSDKILEEIKIEVREASSIVARLRNVHTQMTDTVANTFIMKIENIISASEDSGRWKIPLLLRREEVNNIGNTLIIDGLYGYQTWLHRDLLNSVIFELRKGKVLHPSSPFFQIPQQIQRRLIVNISKDVWDDTRYVLKLRDSLLALEVCDFDSIEDEEIEYICSFVAAACIFAKILFPGFEKKLLRISAQSVSFDPPFITLLLSDSDDVDGLAFYRYFLPPPASMYLFRYILFCLKNKKKLSIHDVLSPSVHIFDSFMKRRMDFSAIFERWLKKKLTTLGCDEIDRLDIASFREACLMASLTDYSVTSQGLPSYPPFILAIQSQKIESDSYPSNQFMLHSGNGEWKQGYKACGKKKTKPNTMQGPPEIISAIDSIREVVTHLPKQSTLKERKEAAQTVRSIVVSLKNMLTPGAFENVFNFSEWVVGMLHVKKNNSKKKIVNYSATVRNLFCNLSDDRPFHKLSVEDQTQAIKRSYATYSTRGVKKELRSFFAFLKAYLSGQFTPPKLNSKEFKKEDSKFTKPLIYPFHVQEALEKADEVYSRYAGKIKNEATRNKKMKEAKHKATAIHHMISLGFQGGVRASEFTNIRIGDVIWDEGLCLCVLTSKTENGLRILPLHLLASDCYLQTFSEYFKQRRSQALNGDEWLFPDNKGGRWDSSHLSSEVVRLFGEIGIQCMRFHILRHGFANWLLLRWFFAFHKEFISDDLPILENEFFREPYVSRLKKVFLGLNAKKGQEVFSHALPVLARLIGHGGPIVTLENYIHTGDWFFFLLSRCMDDVPVLVTSEQAANFLQLSYPSLPGAFKGRGKKAVTMSFLLDGQIEQLLSKAGVKRNFHLKKKSGL